MPFGRDLFSYYKNYKDPNNKSKQMQLCNECNINILPKTRHYTDVFIIDPIYCQSITPNLTSTKYKNLFLYLWSKINLI